MHKPTETMNYYINGLHRQINTDKFNSQRQPGSAARYTNCAMNSFPAFAILPLWQGDKSKIDKEYYHQQLT